MKKTKRFAGGGSGSMVPKELAEEDSALDSVDYDKVKGLEAVTGLDKKSSTRAGRELSDEDRQANTKRIANIGLTAATLGRLGRAGPAIIKGAKAGIKGTKAGANKFYDVIGMKSGGSVASKRADGIAQRGKTKGRMC